MRDFTFKVFRTVLESFIEQDYKILTVEQFASKKYDRCLILRHDVDRFPNNTLKMAQMEFAMGIKSTFYFRIVPSVFRDAVLKEVAGYGHEVSYHYEDLTLNNGNVKDSIESFKINLERIRNYYPCKTICMHGSPASKWDNKLVFKDFDYRSTGIICDTSFDINYNDVFYITDNGMGWNKFNSSVRDKVKTVYDIPIKSSFDLIQKVKSGELPDQVMINAHPDTFFDDLTPWALNYFFIGSKNIIKRAIVKSGIFE